MQGFGPRRVRTCSELGVCQYRQPPCGTGTACMHSPDCSDTACPGRPSSQPARPSVGAEVISNIHALRGAEQVDTAHAPDNMWHFRPGLGWGFWPTADTDQPEDAPERSIIDSPAMWAVLAPLCCISAIGLGLLVGHIAALGPDRFWALLIGGAQ